MVHIQLTVCKFSSLECVCVHAYVHVYVRNCVAEFEQVKTALGRTPPSLPKTTCKQRMKKYSIFFFKLKFSCNLCMHRNVPLELSRNRNNESLHIRWRVSQTGPAMSCLPQPILVSLSFFFFFEERSTDVRNEAMQCLLFGQSWLSGSPLLFTAVTLCSVFWVIIQTSFTCGVFFRPHAVSRTELIPYLLLGSSECTNQEKHSLWKDHIAFHHLLHWTL